MTHPPASAGSGLNQRGTQVSPRRSRSCVRVQCGPANAAQRSRLRAGWQCSRNIPAAPQLFSSLHCSPVPPLHCCPSSFPLTPSSPPAASPPCCTWPRRRLQQQGAAAGSGSRQFGHAHPRTPSLNIKATHSAHRAHFLSATPHPHTLCHAPDELPASSSARSGRRRESEGSGLMPSAQLLSWRAKWVKP